MAVHSRNGARAAHAADGDVAAADGQILADGSEFGRYRIHRLIGSGGVAEVYEASHVEIKKRVAIKVVRPHFAERPHMKQRFVREGEAAARIEHPNAVDITDVGVAKGLPYLVMEYLEGESLGDFIVRHETLDLEQITNVVLPVIAAVAAGHDTGTIHRDLKPDNIFLATDGLRRTMPKVLDFGVSTFTNEERRALPFDDGIVGTPHYMSPEQARGEEVGFASDQYALGVILYELATGQLPRDNESILELVHAVAHESFPPPRKINPTMPEEFEAAILRAMAPLPGDRFPHVRDLGRALLQFASPRAREFWEPEFMGAGEPLELRHEASDMPMMAPDLRLRTNRYSSQPPARPSSSIPPDETPTAPPERPARNRAGLLLALLLFGVGSAVLLFVFMPEENPAPAAPNHAAVPAEMPTEVDTFRVTVQTIPNDATIDLDGIVVGTGTFSIDLPRDGKEHTLRVARSGYKAVLARFRDSAPSPLVRLEPVGRKSAEPSSSRSRATSQRVERRDRNERAQAAEREPRPRRSRRRHASPAKADPEPVRSADPPSGADSASVATAPEEGAEPSAATGETSDAEGVETPATAWPRARPTDNRDPWLD